MTYDWRWWVYSRVREPGGRHEDIARWYPWPCGVGRSRWHNRRHRWSILGSSVCRSAHRAAAFRRPCPSGSTAVRYADAAHVLRLLIRQDCVGSQVGWLWELCRWVRGVYIQCIHESWASAEIWEGVIWENLGAWILNPSEAIYFETESYSSRVWSWPIEASKILSTTVHPPSPFVIISRFSLNADAHFTIPQRVEGWVAT